MPNFKDSMSLKQFLQNEMKKALETTVSEKAKQIESEEIKKVVLNTYRPRKNKRRDEHTGIQAVENMKESVKTTNEKITLSIVNNTPVSDKRHRYRLDETIVTGQNYEFPINNRDEEIYTYLKGRNFIKATQKRINSSGEIKEALKEGLIANGLKISK